MKNFSTKYSIVISVVAVILLIVLLLSKCNHSSTKPNFTNPRTVLDSTNKDEKKTFASNDSLNKENIALKVKDSILEINYNSVKQSETSLSAALRSQLQPNKQDVDNYIDTSEKRDSICDNLNINKDKIIAKKDSIITNWDSLYSHTRASLNFLAVQSAAQLKYEQTLQPKNQLYIGGGVYGNKLSIIQGIHAGLLFKNKQDRIYKGDVMYDFNTGINYDLSTYFKIHK